MDRRADVLYELTDAMLTNEAGVSSPVRLSLATVHRRCWGSLYAALSKGSSDEDALRDLLAVQRLSDGPGRARVYAVDRSS